VDTDSPDRSPIEGAALTHEEAIARELAEAYVSGRIDEADAGAFESHFFACSACWDDVQAAQKFRDGVRDAARRGKLPAAGPAATGWQWAFAAAAAALLAVAGWTLLVQIPGLQAELAEARRKLAEPAPKPVEIALAQPNLPVLMLESSRADAPTALAVPAAAKHVALWLDAPPAGKTPYRLEIVSAGGARADLLTGLEPNTHGALTAAVPAEKLPPGTYTARLAGADGALAAEYRFTIRR